MRLIDADALRHYVLDFPNNYNGFSDTYDKAQIIDAIDVQPTIDAVEVVKCKYCRWGRYEWFCPNGERRNDETN